MARSLLSFICHESPEGKMSDEKNSRAFLDKIFPVCQKKVNPSYVTNVLLEQEKMELEKLRERFARKKSEARQKLDELAHKRSLMEQRKEEESSGIATIIEQTEKKIEKIRLRNEHYKELIHQMEELSKPLEEGVDILQQRKFQYLEYLKAHKPCKDMITAVTKLWPTPINEFELLQRLQTLIRQKVRFSEEYLELYNLRESERKTLLYETAQDAEMNMIILSNKLDELEKEGKVIIEETQKEEEIFNRMMDTGSEVESALSEVLLGCLRLYTLTRPRVKTFDPFEQLTTVLEFGLLLRSVVDAAEQSSKT